MCTPFENGQVNIPHYAFETIQTIGYDSLSVFLIEKKTTDIAYLIFLHHAVCLNVYKFIPQFVADIFIRLVEVICECLVGFISGCIFKWPIEIGITKTAFERGNISFLFIL